MPLECGTIVGLEYRKSDVGKLGPQQHDEIESRHASAHSEELAHQPLGPVSANRTTDPARCDDPQPASVETVRKREQRQVAAADAQALPLRAEKLPAPPNPVAPGQSPIHVVRRRDCSWKGRCSRPFTTRRGACGPSRGAVSEPPCPFSCSSACESRGFACAAGCLADTCASCSHRLRGGALMRRPDTKRTW